MRGPGMKRCRAEGAERFASAHRQLRQSASPTGLPAGGGRSHSKRFRRNSRRSVPGIALTGWSVKSLHRRVPAGPPLDRGAAALAPQTAAPQYSAIL